jgi:hypothetical protein
MEHSHLSNCAARLSMSVCLSVCCHVKADWFAKHRQRRPAIAVVFIDRCAACLSMSVCPSVYVCVRHHRQVRGWLDSCGELPCRCRLLSFSCLTVCLSGWMSALSSSPPSLVDFPPSCGYPLFFLPLCTAYQAASSVPATMPCLSTSQLSPIHRSTRQQLSLADGEGPPVFLSIALLGRRSRPTRPAGSGRARSILPSVHLSAREAVVTDPTSWKQACACLEAVRSAARCRGARVVVAVVVDPLANGLGIPEDRASALARLAGIDRQCVWGLLSQGWPQTPKPDSRAAVIGRHTC